MRCKEARERLRELDQREPPQGDLREHLSDCPDCAAQYRRLQRAEENAAFEPSFDPNLVEQIMAAVGRRPAVSSSKVASLVIWILGGLTLLGAGILVRYSLTFHYLLESHLGSLIDLGVTVAMGVFLVSYLAAFILANAQRLGELFVGEDKKRAGH